MVATVEIESKRNAHKRSQCAPTKATAPIKPTLQVETTLIVSDDLSLATAHTIILELARTVTCTSASTSVNLNNARVVALLEGRCVIPEAIKATVQVFKAQHPNVTVVFQPSTETSVVVAPSSLEVLRARYRQGVQARDISDSTKKALPHQMKNCVP